MKKFILAFIAIVLVSSVSFGQKSSQPTKEQIENGLAEEMEEFIKNLGVFYRNGQSFEQFKAELYKNKNVPSAIPKQGEELLKKAYSYLKKGGATKQQIKKDGIKEMMEAISFIKNSGNEFSLYGVSAASSLSDNGLTSKSPCKWWQLNCWFNEILGFDIWDIWCTLPFVNC